jgi:hypothetical protein
VNADFRRTINIVLIVLAVISFVLAALAAGSDDGEVGLNAVAWLGIGGAFFAGSTLP